MFSSFEVNRAYDDTDLLVSLARLKQHGTTGVTLTMKNMFGITPNSMYGGRPGDEDSIAGRGPIHDARRYVDLELPGLNPGFQSDEAVVRVPCTIADLCAAGPVGLAIIDGITAMTGGESPYSSGPKTRIVRTGRHDRGPKSGLRRRRRHVRHGIQSTSSPRRRGFCPMREPPPAGRAEGAWHRRPEPHRSARPHP